jgi:hypothetical protein
MIKRLTTIILLCGISLCAHSQAYKTTITNFHTRFNTAGEAIDAHDGEIAFFNGVYYLYGTSYDCGFEWGNKGAPFCGFKVYSSTDLVHWTDKGALFDASTPVWQSRCNGATYGCFRPHVIYNKKSKQYVLWINVYDNSVGFRVFTSRSPQGPFTEVANPTLAVNTNSPVAGLNNGDHDTFVDDDGTGYIAYTDWRTQGTIVIEKLSADYLSGTGEHVKAVTSGNTEAPSLFRRKGIYYVTYSDPNCGYCSGTGTSYKTAPSPLGPWSAGIKISNNSCGGQPSFVSVIRLKDSTMYLYGSDLWNNAAKNEALANYYWAPLSFGIDGAILPMECQETATFTLAKGAAGHQLDSTAGVEGFTSFCDISGPYQRSQSFVATRSGTLSTVTYTTFKTGYPDAGLEVVILGDSVLSTTLVPADSISWAPNNIVVHPGIKVEAGKTYKMLLKSASTKGCYGLEYNHEGNGEAYSSDNGVSFSPENNRTLKFQAFIK